VAGGAASVAAQSNSKDNPIVKQMSNHNSSKITQSGTTELVAETRGF